MAFSKSLPKGQIPVGCQLCEGGNKIVWKCTDCNLLMCDRCKDKVHLRIAKDHRIVNIQEIGEVEDSWDSFSFSELKCKEHPNQPCSLYCGTCSTVICLKCIIKVHNGHTFVDEEEFHDKKEILKRKQKKIQNNVNKLISEKEKILTPEENENPKLIQIKQNILEQKKTLFKAVERYADYFVKETYQHFKTAKQEEEIEIDKKIQTMNVKNETLESIVTSRDFIKFFRDFDKLNFSLNEDMSQETTNVLSLQNFVAGEFTVCNFGTLEGSRRLRDDDLAIEFKVTNQWITELMCIHCILRCTDDTLWIGDSTNDMLQHIKLEKDDVTVLSSFNSEVYGIVDISGNILLSTGETRLKWINDKTIVDSVFNIAPFVSRDLHISKDKRVMITARSPGPAFTSTGRGVVIVMDQSGNRLIEYEHDSNKKRLFTVPYKVTSTSNGNIFVVDRLDDKYRARVVVIDKDGYTKRIYTGQHIDTSDKPLQFQGILTIPSGNVFVTDWVNNAVHILNIDGDFISYCSVFDFGIKWPHSLSLSPSPRFFIGCTSSGDGPEPFRAQLYELEYSGI